MKTVIWKLIIRNRKIYKLLVTNNNMEKKCGHNLLKLYYRKKKKEDSKQKWITIKNIYYCDKCKEIIEVK